MTDAVVIGSGPNGLVAANLLADHGWKVAVLEAAPTPGGGVRSAELIEPGFVNDVCSAFYPLTLASPTIGALGLDRHGLRWRQPEIALAHPALDGSVALVSRDVEVTAASLDAFHPGDGAAWRELFALWDRVEAGLLGSLLRPFPPIRPALGLATRMKPAELLRFTRFAMLPVRRMGEETFQGEGGRRLLAGGALHADFTPEQTLSGFFGWIMASLAQSVGYPVPEGGASALTGALVRRLEAGGGTVSCQSAVARVEVRKGRAVGVTLADGTTIDASRAVIADVNAPMLYHQLVASEHLPAQLFADLEKFHWDEATIKVDWNLDGPIPWTAEATRRAGTVHVSESVDSLTASSSELARGLVPAQPFLLVGQQSRTDPTRSPAGTETAWAYTHVPRRVKGDAGGDGLSGRWDDSEGQRMADRMEAEIEALAPGFRQLVRGRHVMTPPMFTAENPNLDGSSIMGGTSQLHQQLIFRPVPGLGRAETPVKGLFLASGSAHPGGGVHGAAGSNAAKAAIAADLRHRIGKAVGRP